MIDEEKVILMTDMAVFEKEHIKKDMDIVHYFRSDYIGFQVLKAVLAGTISFLCIFAVYLFYNFEELMSDIYEMDLLETGKGLIITYLVCVGVYALICYAIYSYRYSKAKKELKGFFMNLRKLDKMRNRKLTNE